jgi:hypothetical protein
MSGERVFSLHNPWFTSAIAATALIAVLAAAAGFLWFPSLETQSEVSVWLSAYADKPPATAPSMFVEPIEQRINEAGEQAGIFG